MKVLVVDDSKAMRMIVIRTLKQTGLGTFQTVEANNGAEALTVIAEHKPDLVLSDWNMPEMKGIDLLKKLRESGNAINFGFITSESSPEVRKEAEDAGASFLITKPFTANSFEAALSPVLA